MAGAYRWGVAKPYGCRRSERSGGIGGGRNLGSTILGNDVRQRAYGVVFAGWPGIDATGDEACLSAFWYSFKDETDTGTGRQKDVVHPQDPVSAHPPLIDGNAVKGDHPDGLGGV